MTQTAFASEVVRAYDASVPLAHCITPDEPGTHTLIARTLGKDTSDPPCVFLQSPLMGLEPIGDRAAADLPNITQGNSPDMLSDPATLLRCLATLPSGGTTGRVILWSGADRAWSDPGLAGALLLMRDRLAERGVTLLGTGADVLQGGITQHVHVLRDELPDDGERRRLLEQLLTGNEVKIGEGDLDRAVNGTRGLTRFAVEQVASLASWTGTLDLDTLFARWRESLGALPGVTVEDPMPRQFFAGYEGYMAHVERYRKAAPSLVVIFDEFEKVLPDMDSRDSGVSKALLGLFLTEMSRVKPIANISMGPMGTGKSLSALVAASVFGCPVISVDMSAWKTGEVGMSERNARECLRAIRAFGGRQFWTATSNGLANVDGPLKSRFRGGVWWFGLPLVRDMAQTWLANSQRFDVPLLPGNVPPVHGEGWTGRDVESTLLECRDQEGLDLQQQADNRVPTGRALAADIERMSQEAVRGSFRCAHTGRPYTGETTAPAASGRALRRAAAPAPVAAPVAQPATAATDALPAADAEDLF